MGTGVPGGTAGGGGSSIGPLAIISFTRFPHCLRTCATCSLLIPARSVSPIFKMWSPLHNLPCWRKNDDQKKSINILWFLPRSILLEKDHTALVTFKTHEPGDFFQVPSQYPDNTEKKRRLPNDTLTLLEISPEISRTSLFKQPVTRAQKKMRIVMVTIYWYLTTACWLENFMIHFQTHFQKTAYKHIFSFALLFKNWCSGLTNFKIKYISPLLWSSYLYCFIILMITFNQ